MICLLLHKSSLLISLFLRELQRQYNEEDEIPDLVSCDADQNLNLSADSAPTNIDVWSEEAKTSDRSAIHRHDSIADENSEAYQVYHFNGLEVRY